MTAPLVWLPFAPERLGEVPDGLRCDEVLPTLGDLPAAAAEVELFVPAYDWDVDLAVLGGDAAAAGRADADRRRRAHPSARPRPASCCATVGGSMTPRPPSSPWR